MDEAFLPGGEGKLLPQSVIDNSPINTTEEADNSNRPVVFDFSEVFPPFWNEDSSIEAPCRRLFSAD
jgi:hypothetical protein